MISAAASLCMIVLCLFGHAAAVGAAGSPTFSVTDASGKAGDTVTVNAVMSDNPGIVAFRLLADYDSDVLTLTNARVKDFESVSFGPTDKVPFSFLWSEALNGNVTDNGVMAELTFKISEDAASGSYPIKLSYDEDDVFDDDFVNVKFAVAEGKITVSGSGSASSKTDTSSKSDTSSKPKSDSSSRSDSSGRTDTSSKSDTSSKKDSSSSSAPSGGTVSKADRSESSRSDTDNAPSRSDSTESEPAEQSSQNDNESSPAETASVSSGAADKSSGGSDSSAAESKSADKTSFADSSKSSDSFAAESGSAASGLESSKNSYSSGPAPKASRTEGADASSVGSSEDSGSSAGLIAVVAAMIAAAGGAAAVVILRKRRNK